MPSWDVIIDWTAVLAKLGLEPADIEDLPKGSREQAVSEVERTFGADALFEKDPQEIDQLITDALERILKKKNYFQKHEKAKKEKADATPHIEIFPIDGIPDEFKQMFQDALENAKGTDFEQLFDDMLSKFYKNKNKAKSKPKGKDKGTKRDDEDPAGSMFI